MKAYVIVIDSEIMDAEGLAGVAAQMTEETTAHGGRYLVRGSDVTVFAGDSTPEQVTVIEFDSSDQAKALFESETFAELRAQRYQFVRASSILVEGV